jgi:UDP-3-O-[3-hydroxymyristoyl] glucosamine N-acyltransferase
MRVTVRDIARLVGGTVQGDENLPITGISSLTEARPGDISFLANPKYESFLGETRASAVLVSTAYPMQNLVQIVVGNPDFAFARVVATYGPKAVPPPPGVHPSVVIGERVRLGRNVAIGAYAVIADGASIGDNSVLYPHVYVGNDTHIGEDCLVYPQVVIRERCEIGDRVILHSGVVIGSDGFGYASVEGVHHKIPQVGVVVIEDDVEIGANTCLDRARFGRTRIGKGTKIDNLVQIAHNVESGHHCIFVGQCGIAGSTKIGNHVILSGQSGIGGHLTIGDHAIVTGKAGVSKNIPPHLVVRGTPAQEIKAAQVQEVAVRRLPATQAVVKDLQARVTDLERRLAALAGQPARTVTGGGAARPAPNGKPNGNGGAA